MPNTPLAAAERRHVRYLRVTSDVG